jgi:hypothetical protein
MAKKSGIAMVVTSLVLGAGAGAAVGGCGDDDRGSVDVEGGTTGTMGTVGTTTTPQTTTTPETTTAPETTGTDTTDSSGSGY